ncbi:EscU/YscU/HrcU family type III secretion system export apparatus switch protein [Ureibacillus sp. FSL K6-8385]|uniref:Type III secretion system protein n=1 Tax=Ureibacillus terrenus TaxID=118246 RepID=A0A540V4E7_9BACL|nr:EscU/YscU/HrcU family type III secretion system export apparatus switch protein [Ureibacillus terrenus]MED3660382.1 EscU/YscU/HrcU family type III secretion system export apparatus switch protein [Ureibacillus terrenus]MED3762538.1 EscU/YscU/HrcU family type III secretion system export apparatus switch protein [Ureibacillus terrenus]TQE91604.1 type III secretion system protein [Ureibacillus terrenus]
MTEKRMEAVALSYHPEDASPKVIAKGKGKIAENILQVAEKHHIPVYEDPNLLELLGQLDLNESIPPDLYEAVAEVFAFIYRLDRRIQSKR